MIGRAKGNSPISNIRGPRLLKLRRSALFKKLVELIDNGHKAVLHLLRRKLDLIYQAVNLVDEENRFHTLLKRLAHNCFSLRHAALNRAGNNHNTIHSTHGTGHVPAEVHVARSIYHVDQVFFLLKVVDHRNVSRVYSDTTGLFLFIRIKIKLASSKLRRNKPGSREQVIAERGLTMINMRDNTNVTDALRRKHHLLNLTNHLLTNPHSPSPHLAAFATRSISSLRPTE
ncbi:hypothetical protein BMS3Abin16_00105 [archaeon BMS3Abin16]|nr:hypothetical protein BMS3Abin16_00105 [archaeon BMS3Abin16]